MYKQDLVLPSIELYIILLLLALLGPGEGFLPIPEEAAVLPGGPFTPLYIHCGVPLHDLSDPDLVRLWGEDRGADSTVTHVE